MSLPDSIKALDYSDGRTKQGFKDETDINVILKKAQRKGTLSHLERHGAHYADYSDVPDLLTAHARIQAGQAVFDELPSELRSEFGNSQFAFFEFVNKTENAGKLHELLPQLAEPGQQLPAVRRSASTEANPALASAEMPPAGSDAVSAPATPPPAEPAAPPPGNWRRRGVKLQFAT